MRKRSIVAILDRAKSAKNEAEAKGGSGLPVQPHERIAFVRWLSAYQHQLEDLCSTRTFPCSDGQPEANHAEAAPERR